MAQIKRTVRTVGQRITGLYAGNQYVFTLKRPNLRPDLENARRATRIAKQQLVAVRKLAKLLEQARDEATRGSIDSAREMYGQASDLFAKVKSGIADAKDYFDRATEDANEAVSEVKDAYSAGKDAAEQAVTLAQQTAKGIGRILEVIGAVIEEAAART